MRFRTGGKLERTLYLQLGPTPDHRPPADGGDLLIGMLDPGWGPLVVELLNTAANERVEIDRYPIGPVVEAVDAALERRRANPAP